MVEVTWSGVNQETQEAPMEKAAKGIIPEGITEEVAPQRRSWPRPRRR
jgi:hypothetical protein